MQTTRRGALAVLSRCGLTLLVGCGGSDDGGGEVGIAGPTPAPSPTPALTSTVTPTPFPTSTPTGTLAPALLVQAGDSIGAGVGAGGYAAIDHLGLANLSVYNGSVDGRTMLVGLATSDDLLRFYDKERRSILLIEQGTNDLGAANRSADDLYFNTTTPFVHKARQGGWLVIVNTLLLRWDATWNAQKEHQRLLYNDLVRSNLAAADIINDVAANPVMGDRAIAAKDYYPDLLHPNGSGQDILAALLRSILQAALSA